MDPIGPRRGRQGADIPERREPLGTEKPRYPISLGRRAQPSWPGCRRSGNARDAAQFGCDVLRQRRSGEPVAAAKARLANPDPSVRIRRGWDLARDRPAEDLSEIFTIGNAPNALAWNAATDPRTGLADLARHGARRAGLAQSLPHDAVKKSDTPGFEPTRFGSPSF